MAVGREAFALYIAGLVARGKAWRRRLRRRVERAVEAARAAAESLHQRYRVALVWLFGSALIDLVGRLWAYY